MTPQIYNRSTGKKEAIPEDALNDAVASGTHAFPVGTKVNVLDPDGNVGSLDSSELQGALQSGFTIEPPRKTAVREYVDENKGLKGAAKVALGQFADEALMGIPELILNKTQDPLEVAKREALKKEHNAVNNIAGIAGFGTSLLYGGPLGKVATGAEAAGRAAENLLAKRLVAAGVEKGSESIAKGLAKKLATSATKLGVEGATFSAPVALTEAALGDPDLAAETLLMNGLAGAALGVGGSAVKSLAKLGIEALPENLISTIQNKAGAKALGFTKGQINKLKGGQKEAEQIADDVLNMTTSTGERLIEPLDSAMKIASKIDNEITVANKDVGEVYKFVDDSGQKAFSPQVVRDAIEKHPKLGQFYRDEINKDVVHIYDNALNTLGKEEAVSLTRAKMMLDKLDGTAFPGGKRPPFPTEKQTIAYEMRKVVREELNKAADIGAKALGDEAAISRLTTGNQKIHTLLKAKNAINQRVSSESGNKLLGLTDVIAGAGVGAVNPIAGLATVVAKRAAEKYGNQIVASSRSLLHVEQAMKKTALAMDTIPSALDDMIKKTAKPIKNTAVGAISRFLGNEDSKQTKLEQFEDLSNRVAEFNENPAYASDKVSGLTKGLNTGAPMVANNFATKNVVLARYIQEMMPKPMSISTPFKQVRWKPSDFELSQFERRIHAISDPLSIIEDLKNNNLSMEAVNAVKTVYPKLFEKIQEKVLNHFMENPQTVPYQQRIKLSMLLDQPLDSDLQPVNIASLQKNFILEDNAVAAGKKPLDLPSTASEVQSISG